MRYLGNPPEINMFIYKTIALGRLLHSGIVLAKKLNLKDSVFPLYGRKKNQSVLVTECTCLR